MTCSLVEYIAGNALKTVRTIKVFHVTKMVNEAIVERGVAYLDEMSWTPSL